MESDNQNTNGGHLSNNIIQLGAALLSRGLRTQVESGNKRRWTVLTEGGGRGMSLPEYFIREPKKFLNDYYSHYRDFEWDEDDQLTATESQAFEIIENIGHIELPLRFRGKATVLQGRIKSLPYQFEMIEHANEGRLDLLWRASTDLISRTCFDLLWPYRKRISDKDFKRVTGYVLKYIDDDQCRVWDRWRCEWFFSTAANFVPRHNRTYI